MRIGFDAKRVFSNSTGLGNYSRDTISLLSYYFNDNKYFLFTPKKKYKNKLNFVCENKNLTICTPNTLINKVFKNYWRSRSMIKDLCKNKVDVYHGLSNELPIGIELTNIKTVVTIHDLIFIRFPYLFNFFDRKIYLKKFKSACLRADKIIAISKQTKKDIINYLAIPEEKIDVVYQGCNNIFQNEIAQVKKEKTVIKYKLPKKYLLYVGTIEERKNLLTVLKTLNEIPNQKLVVIGEGKAYKNKCLKFIKKNKISDRVIFLTGISLEEMAIIYQLAEIMIYPSIFEGFGIPIIEALFSKTPVITSKGGCFSEAGGPHSKYINPLSISEMKKAILEIQMEPEIKKNMKNNGFSYAQNFTDYKIASKLIQIYSDL